MKEIKFNSVLIIGMGLMGSSISRALYNNKLANKISGLDTSDIVINSCKKLNLLDKIEKNLDNFNEQFDLIIICSPLSSYFKIFESLNNFVSKQTLLTDIGSTKASVIHDFKKQINNENIKFLPSHPIAGLEKIGPEYGFAELFKDRFCIVTPLQANDSFADNIIYMWKKIGMQIEIMDPESHDRILAMTSHVPQLIAYSVVDTATGLEEQIKNEVIKYSAAGFRDFTRLAGSDPIMWRDIYSLNKEPVIEMLGRFTEDLTTLQKAIRNEDLKFLENTFSSTREIRQTIENLGQAGSFDPTEKIKK